MLQTVIIMCRWQYFRLYSNKFVYFGAIKKVEMMPTEKEKVKAENSTTQAGRSSAGPEPTGKDESKSVNSTTQAGREEQ
jgi:hypothetical protein